MASIGSVWTSNEKIMKINEYELSNYDFKSVTHKKSTTTLATTNNNKSYIINIYRRKEHIYYIGSAVGYISFIWGNWNSSFQTILIHSNTPGPVSPKINTIFFLKITVIIDTLCRWTLHPIESTVKHKRIIWSGIQRHLIHAAISQRHCVWVLTVQQSEAEFSICLPW